MLFIGPSNFLKIPKCMTLQHNKHEFQIRNPKSQQQSPNPFSIITPKKQCHVDKFFPGQTKLLFNVLKWIMYEHKYKQLNNISHLVPTAY